MRRSELLELRWEDSDLEHRVAHIRRKGSAASGSPQRYRIVPLSAATLKLLKTRAQGHGRIIKTTICGARAAFERSKKEVGIEGLRFNDL